jgi:hypothetical protein
VIDATPLLRHYARFRLRRLARADPVQVQRRTLQRLVARAATTRFGREHGFEHLKDVAAFQRAVPIRRYEEFWTTYWQPAFPRLEGVSWPGLIPYFALSSGTTSGVTKYLPVSHAMVRSNRAAAIDVLVHHLCNRPHSRVFGGRTFMLGGSTALDPEAEGVLSGDLSGIGVQTTPFWARPYAFPPPELALLSDWEVKLERLAPRSLEADVRAISGVPSWLLLFFDQLFALHPERPHRLAAFYPDLELLVHGGIAFTPYQRTFESLLEGSHAELREVYPASEGFFAVADRAQGEGLRLLTDTGIFYEFVPVGELGAPAPTRHTIADLEPGTDYAIVVSTCAGLFAYLVGDTVRFLERDPPRLVVTGRTSYSLSAFGEHLTGEEVEGAVAEAAEAVGLALADLAVGPVFPQGRGERGRHLFVVEGRQGALDQRQLEALSAAIDRRLSATNADYRAHRAEGFGLDPPEVLAMPPGGFEDWMRARGQLGGQHKVPRIVNDPDLFDDLRAVASGGQAPPAGG